MTKQDHIEKTLNQIEERLFSIEKKLDTPVSIKPTTPAKAPTPVVKAPAKPMSGNWLGMVASVCFVLAAAFIFKLSIESGWLTHEKQLGLATLLGLALFAGGIFISHRDRIYASFLPAAGSVILYLTCFAAYHYYTLISFQTVIAITCIVSGLSVWFYIQFKHDVYAVIAAIGAYSAPILADLQANTIFSLYYFIICSFTFATLSIWMQSRTLTVISAYLAISITAFIGLNLHMDGIIALILALTFLIFSLGTYFHTYIFQQGLTEKEAWSFFPVLLIFYAMEYYYLSRINTTLAAWVSLLVVAFLIVLYYSARRRAPKHTFSSSPVLITFVTLVCFHAIYLILLPTLLKPWLFAAIVIASSLCYKKVPWSRLMITPVLAGFAILGIEYLNILTHLTKGFSLTWALVAWASLASLWFAIAKHRKMLSLKDQAYYSLLALTHLLGIMALYQCTIDYGSLAVSSSWLLYALVVLGFAYLENDIHMAKSVVIVLSFAAGKALLYDAQSTPTLIRTLCLILTGIVLYTSGFVIRKMTHWKP